MMFGASPTDRARTALAAVRARGFLGAGRELPILVALLAATRLLPTPAPVGVYGVGLVQGGLLALHAISIVLVYRSNRIINFAQVAFGSSAAILFAALVQYAPLLRLVDPLCARDCTESPLLVSVNYWLSLALSLALAATFGWVTYLFVVRRFRNAPPLVLTVATIFVGFAAIGLTSQLADAFVPEELRESGAPLGAEPASLPFDFAVEVGGVSFHAVDFLTLVCAGLALLGLFLYLRRSAVGTVIRAAAENPDRAATLGVNVSAVTGRVWIASALLAGVAGTLGAMAQGIAGAGGGAAVEVRILAVAVVARMVNLPLATAAALILAMIDQATQWSFKSPAPFDASLFVLIGVLLLTQSARTTRAETAVAGEWRAAREIRRIPGELRDLPVVRTTLGWAAAGGSLVLLGAPWLLPPAKVNLAAAIMIYAITGLSLLILTGWGGQISLGQVAFAAIGAYVAAITKLPFPLAVLLGSVAGAAVALLIGMPALRLRGLHLAVMTLAFHQAVVAVVLNQRYLGAHLPDGLDRPSFLGVDFSDQRAFYYLSLAALGAVAIATLGLRRSRTARALLATRDNEQAAQSFGISLTRARVGAFVVSGFVSAFGGTMLAYHQNGVPAAAFSVELSRTVFLHAVIGGLGTIAGPLVGFVYYGLPQLLQLPGLIALLLSGPGGLLLLLMTPGGLAQLVFDGRDRWLRRLARRERIAVPSLIADDGRDASDERAALAPPARNSARRPVLPGRYALDAQWAIGAGATAAMPQATDATGGRDVVLQGASDEG